METSSRGLNSTAGNLPVSVQTCRGRGAGLRGKHQLPLQNSTGKRDPHFGRWRPEWLLSFSEFFRLQNWLTEKIVLKYLLRIKQKNILKDFVRVGKSVSQPLSQTEWPRKTPRTPAGPSPPCSRRRASTQAQGNSQERLQISRGLPGPSLVTESNIVTIRKSVSPNQGRKQRKCKF